MLTIQRSQWKLLADASKRRFFHRLIAHARENFEGWEPEDRAAMAAVERVYDEAFVLGVTDELGICRFLNAAVLSDGVYRGRFPWIAAILCDTSRPAHHRLDEIDRRVEAELSSPIAVGALGVKPSSARPVGAA